MHTDLNLSERYIDSILESYQTLKGIAPRDGSRTPLPNSVANLVFQIRNFLFPGYFDLSTNSSIKEDTRLRINKLSELLTTEIHKCLNLEGISDRSVCPIVDQFFQFVPKLRERLHRDIRALDAGDPAAKSELEILLAYPGFTAIMMYRIANCFHTAQVPLLPRMITELAHTSTGIDIHPGATIGEYFCIDHGTGIVVGETTVIGKNVKLYQGVTLGALSVVKTDSQIKRHPTIEDGVTIYAGTTILGGETVIGHDSVIGGNVWLIESVPAFSKIYRTGEPQQILRSSKPDL